MILALICTATPAFSWDFSPLPICTMTHATDDATVTVTYDAQLPEYAITITLTDAIWPAAPRFTLGFEGALPMVIGTDRHVVDDNALTVRDSGFGNVLDGLALNDMAIASVAGRAEAIPLSGATEAVAAFRLCPAVNTS